MSRTCLATVSSLCCWNRTLCIQFWINGINGEALQDGSQEEGRRFQQLRLKLKMANNWAGVSRFSRVNCETNCDWIVIVCLINYGEINIKYKNKYDYKINMFFFCPNDVSFLS